MRAVVSAVILLVLVPSIGFAQFPAQPEDFSQLSIEDLISVDVVTPSRQSESALTAPAVVDVLTVDDIRASGATQLSQLLEMLPGVYTPSTAAGGQSLSVRGVQGRFNTHTLLLIDGFPYRTLYFANHPINEQIPLEDVQRIEVIRGPGSVMYGSNAFAGVVNIITKSADDIPRNEVSFGAGSWGTQRHHGIFRKRLDDGEFVFTGSFLESNGYEIGHDEDGDLSRKQWAKDDKSLQLRVRHGRLRLQARHSRNVTPDIAEPFLSTDDQIRNHTLLQMSFEATDWLTLRAYHNIFDYESDKDEGTEDGAIAEIKRTEIASRISGVDFQSSKDLGSRNSLVMGALLEREHLDHMWTRNWDPPTDPYETTSWIAADLGDTPTSVTNYNWALYAEDHIRIHDKLTANLGLRHDGYEASEARTNPRAGLVYTPWGSSSLKILYGEAFRSPSYRELYKQTDDGENEGNPDLNPEVMRTLELAMTQGIGRGLSISASVFQSQFDDAIALVGNGNYANVGSREYRGVETSLKKFFRSLSLAAFANYSFVLAEEEDGSDIGAVPQHMANVGLSYRGLDYFDVSTFVKFVGRRALPPDYQEDVDEEKRQDNLGSYTVVDFSLRSKRVLEPYFFSVGVRNVLDTEFFTQGEKTYHYDVRGPGRQLLISVGQGF